MSSRIEELLVDWEIARQDGLQFDAEHLCRDCPELVDELRQRIEQLKRTSWLFRKNDRTIAGRDDTLYDFERARDTERFTPIDPETFLERVAECGLVPVEQIDAVKQDFASDANLTTLLLADTLVNSGVLTRYQADVLSRTIRGPLNLDRYVVLEKIGAGGMGDVYKARHTVMDRLVALKVLPHSATLSEDRRARFFREIKAVSQVNHPNIVTAYDAHDAFDCIFFAMELVNGNDLADVVRESGPIAVEDSVAIIRDVACALEAAHQSGIVHRDVKPSNILLDNDGRAKLLDLGLARFKQETIEESFSTSDLTGAGMPMGTVAFMSPEQAVNAHNAGPAADQYSLGCTWIFLLTGKSPFVDRGPVQVLVAHRDTSPAEMIAGLTICEPYFSCLIRMLSKSPEDRFESMEQLTAALDRVGEVGVATGQPVQAYAEERQPQMPQVVQARDADVPVAMEVGTDDVYAARVSGRNKFLIGAVAALLLVTIAGSVIWQVTSRAAQGNGVISGPAQSDLARWIINEGGLVRGGTEFGEQNFEEVAALPTGGIQIREVSFPSALPNLQLEKLVVLPELRLISITGNRITLQDSELLKSITSLRSLSVSQCSLHDSFCQSVSEMSGITRLEIIDCEVDPDDLDSIGNMTSLTSLDVSDIELNQDFLDMVSGLEWLEELRIPNTGIGVEAIHAGNWRVLNLSENDITDADFETLPPATSLAVIQLDFNPLGDGAASYLAKCPGLTHVYFEETRLTDVGLQSLMECKALQHLDIAATRVTTDGLKMLTGLPQLSGLNVSRIGIDAQTLKRITVLRGLSDLNISESAITDAGLDQLSEMNLESLDVTGCNLSEFAIGNFIGNNPDCLIYTD